MYDAMDVTMLQNGDTNDSSTSCSFCMWRHISAVDDVLEYVGNGLLRRSRFPVV